MIQFPKDNFWHTVYPEGATEQQILNELSDFEKLISSVSIVYDHVTGGRASKPLTDASVICSLADEHYSKDNECEVCAMQEQAND